MTTQIKLPPADLLGNAFSFIEKPHLTAQVCKDFERPTKLAFSYIWRALQNDPIFASDVLLIPSGLTYQLRVKIICERVLQRARSTGCPILLRGEGVSFVANLSAIVEATSLHVFFSAINLSTFKEIFPPLLTGDLLTQAKAISVWMPDHLNLLKGIKTLALDRLHLHHLPNQLGFLTGLTKLTISGNLLTKIPESIELLTQLQILDLSHNLLKELPPLRKCTDLWHVHLSNNRFTRIPEMKGCYKLCILDLSQNKIVNWKMIFACLPNRQIDLRIERNPVVPERPKIPEPEFPKPSWVIPEHLPRRTICFLPPPSQLLFSFQLRGTLA